MNTPTLVASLVMAAVLAVVALLVIRAMMRGWLRRARRQAELIGRLPPVPTELGPVTIEPTPGLYVGSTLAPSWQDRIAVGDLGYRARAVLTRHTDGILMQRSGATPLWIPEPSITAIRTERAIAGKVLTHAGILAIRWRLPSGTEIDTGFRGNDRRKYAQWVEQP
ncbi:transporter [Mycobacterium sp.]|uniref:PH-like domain-containing protein n=1 Tax=Mycobacterium sp. TaxID=1785 RepID=UPI002D6CD142|nr:transporter [Mycobacterium sp.]HZA12472.1 transporter [Mycobacterium sp.]